MHRLNRSRQKKSAESAVFLRGEVQGGFRHIIIADKIAVQTRTERDGDFRDLVAPDFQREFACRFQQGVAKRDDLHRLFPYIDYFEYGCNISRLFLLSSDRLLKNAEIILHYTVNRKG